MDFIASTMASYEQPQEWTHLIDYEYGNRYMLISICPIMTKSITLRCFPRNMIVSVLKDRLR